MIFFLLGMIVLHYWRAPATGDRPMLAAECQGTRADCRTRRCKSCWHPKPRLPGQSPSKNTNFCWRTQPFLGHTIDKSIWEVESFQILPKHHSPASAQMLSWVSPTGSVQLATIRLREGKKRIWEHTQFWPIMEFTDIWLPSCVTTVERDESCVHSPLLFPYP